MTLGRNAGMGASLSRPRKARSGPRGAVVLLLAGGMVVGGLVAPHATSAAVQTSGAAPTATVHPRSAALPTTTYAVIGTINVGGVPAAIAIDQDDDTIYVANFESDTVSIVRGSDDSVVDTIAVGNGPCDLAVDTVDDTIYVANFLGGTLSVINGREVDDSATIALGPNPCGVGVNQIDDTVYVLNADDSDMSVINGRSPDDSVTINVGHYPQAVAVDQNDDTVYVTNDDGDSLSVINGRILDDSVTIGVGSGPKGVAVNDADDTVYVANNSGGTLSVINGRRLGDSATIAGLRGPIGVAVDQADGRVYVADNTGDTVSVINGATGAGIDDSIFVGGSPYVVAKSITTRLVYVGHDSGNTVSVISDVTPSIEDTGAVGEFVNVDIAFPCEPNCALMDDSTVTSVFFDGTPVSDWSRDSGSNSLTVQVPPGTGTVDVTVAFNGGNVASAGTFTYVTPGPPGTPYGWTGSGTATMKWASPDDTGDAAVTSFVLEWATSPSGPWDDSITVPRARATVTGLANGTAYWFRVSAVNAFGTGTPSAASSPVTPRAFANWAYTLDDTVAIPYAMAVAVTDDSVYVVNDSIGFVSVVRASDLAVSPTPIRVGENPSSIAVTPDQLTAFVTNQNNDDSSVSVIRLRDDSVTATIGGFFEPRSVAALDDTAYVGNFGDNQPVSVIRASDNTVNGSIAGSYVQAIAATPDGTRAYVANEYSVTKIATATNSPTTITDPSFASPQGIATTDDTVFVANYGTYGASYGDNSVSVLHDDTIVATVPLPAGSGPTAVATSPDGTRAYVANAKSDTVSVIDTSTNTVTASVSLPTGSTPSALAVGTNGRHVYVVGRGRPGFIGAVYVIGVKPLPGAPTAVAAAPGDDTASVSWTIDDTGGSELTRINFALDDTDTIDDSTTNTASPHTLTGLTNGRTYRVYVQAVNANGAGPWSTYATVTPRQAPAAPVITSVTPGNASVSVSWTADDTGGSALTSINFALDDTATIDDSTTNTAGPHTLTGLTNGATYRVYVQAVNVAGPGAWSLASSPVTPTAPPGPPGPPSQLPTITPASQSLSGVAGSRVAVTAAFRPEGFTSTPRYGIYPPLPLGLSLDPATGVVSGTPQVAYPSTRHWITATAGSGTESATSLLQVYVAETPEPPSPATPTLVITGTRTQGRAKPAIRVTGIATGLDRGSILRPWFRFPGQASFTEGAARVLVDDRGRFAWERLTGRKVYIYLQTEDGETRSNRITISA